MIIVYFRRSHHWVIHLFSYCFFITKTYLLSILINCWPAHYDLFLFENYWFWRTFSFSMDVIKLLIYKGRKASIIDFLERFDWVIHFLYPSKRWFSWGLYFWLVNAAILGRYKLNHLFLLLILTVLLPPRLFCCPKSLFWRFGFCIISVSHFCPSQFQTWPYTKISKVCTKIRVCYHALIKLGLRVSIFPSILCRWWHLKNTIHKFIYILDKIETINLN